MRHLVFLAATAALMTGCATERVEIIHEMVGCTSDAMCDDRDETTGDWCEADSGFCNHERVVEGGLCASAADCDDGDGDTLDACEGGDCHHTREVAAPYDPRAHQDHVAYCEGSATAWCDEGMGPHVTSSISVPCNGERYPWSEGGYFTTVVLYNPPADLRRLHIRPSLRAGDPDDLLRVTVNHYTRAGGTPILVQDMTGTALETDGITVPVVPTPDELWMGVYMSLVITFADDTYRSRAMQWALLPGDVTDADAGTDFVTCPIYGAYVDTPEHGLLRLAADPSTGVPVCEGEVRRLDPWAEMYPDTHARGLFRTRSDPTLRWASDLEVPPHFVEFRDLREFLDWFVRWGEIRHDTLCAGITVYSDEQLELLRSMAVPETVGARPGTPVSWLDASSVRHFGYAARQWTILDFGTDETTAFGSPPRVWSEYGSFLGDGSTHIDLQWLVSRYTVVPTAPGSVDPQDLRDDGLGIRWYNDDPPGGP